MADLDFRQRVVLAALPELIRAAEPGEKTDDVVDRAMALAERLDERCAEIAKAKRAELDRLRMEHEMRRATMERRQHNGYSCLNPSHAKECAADQADCVRRIR